PTPTPDTSSTSTGVVQQAAAPLPPDPVSSDPLTPTPVVADNTDVTAQALAQRVAGPGYGMNIFIWDSPATTDRDLGKVAQAGFGWQKSLFQWRLIEPKKGEYNWSEADRVVRAS